MPTRNILPCYDNEGAVGSSSKTWAEGRFYDLYCKGTPWIDVRIYGETTGFALAVAAIGSTSSVLYIPNEQSVTGDVTVPATLTLKFSPGGFLNIATTKTVTINGNIEAGLTKIFSCAGTGKVVFGAGAVKEVYPEWWGASPSASAAINTVAIQAAVDSGKNVFINEGTYIFGTLSIPETSYFGLKIFGAGMGKTILQSGTINTVMFQKSTGGGIFTRYIFSDFSVKAHASGSTGAAFNLTGTHRNLFARISYLSNGTGNYAVLFDLAAHPYPCYGNAFEDITVDSQSGPIRVWRFHNDGEGVLSNANVQYIIRPWIYNNTGIDVIIAGAYSYSVNIRDGFFEENPATTVIQSGRGMIIDGCYFEGNLANGNITYTSDPVNGTSLDGTVIGCHFVDAQTIDFPSGVYGNVWINNLNSINTTFTGDSRNRKLKQEYLITGTDVILPNISRVGGQTGTPGTIIKTTVINPTVDGELSGIVRLPWTPDGAGTTVFDFAALTGYTLISVSFGATDSITGSPCVSAVDTAQIYGRVNVTFTTTNLHNIDAWVKYRIN